jgi:SAM-dependent methyltransferase
MASQELPFSPAAERNKQPILDVLRGVMPARARVLEIASGTGQHAAHFAAACPGWTWQPSDTNAAALPAIVQRCAGLSNVPAPLHIDVLAPSPWPTTQAVDAVYCANMLHVSPWSTCAALMRGASRHLAESGRLILYGPFIIDGEPTAPSNLTFDADLHARDATWGLRRLADVVAQAEAAGLALKQRIAMPSNNLMLVFSR